MKHAIWILFCATTLSHGQGSLQPMTITFEGPPVVGPGGYRLEREYYESGVWFRTKPPQVWFERWYRGPPPDNGSTSLRHLGESLLFSFSNNDAFALVSVDLAELTPAIANPATVRFIGYRQDGLTVTADFTTDGVLDGVGGLADFETFHFGPEFSGLTLVEIPGFPFTGCSLDNLVLIIPEPSSLALLALGGGLVASRLLRRRLSS